MYCRGLYVAMYRLIVQVDIWLVNHLEVKYPTQGTPHSSLEKDNSLNHSSVSPKMSCLENTLLTKK